MINNKETIQTVSFTLVYALPKKVSFNIAEYKAIIDSSRSNYEILVVFSTTYDFRVSLDETKLIKNDEYIYYYVVLSYPTRQKLIKDKINGNIVLPRYLAYEYSDKTEIVFPSFVEKNSSLNSTESVFYVLERLFKQNKNVSRLGFFTNLSQSYRTFNLEAHFRKLCNLETLEEFLLYIQTNNLLFYLDTIFSKLSSLTLVRKKVKELNLDIDFGKDPSYISILLGTESPILLDSNLNPTFKLESNKIGEDIYSEQQIKDALLSDEYDNSLGNYIFSSDNKDKLKPLLQGIYKENSNSYTKSNGLRFLFNIFDIRKNSYRTKNQTTFKQLTNIFEYFSEDYKSNYKKYIE